MTSRESFSYSGGRASPYTLSHNDRSLSDMYEYVERDDYRQYPSRNEDPIEDDDDPDVINLRYLGQPFKIEFPAFAISESRVFVSDLRRKVARRLSADPRTIRLVYKDRDLRNDARSLKFYGCKQNSEVGVVVTENLNDYGHVDGPSSEDDAYRPQPTADRRRSRAGSSVRDRQMYAEEHSRSEDHSRSGRASGFLHPEIHTRPARQERRSVSPGRPTPTTSRGPRDPSPAPAPSQPTATSVPPSPRRVSRPAADPNSPMGKVQALQAKFYDLYLPEAGKFLRSPPSDVQQRQNTYNQVVENLMKHVIEAADGITTGDDTDARAERRKVVTEAQEILKRLDTAHQQWSK